MWAPLITRGFQTCKAVDIDLKDVPALLIGSEGKGEISFHTMQSRMSLPAAAISLGIMEGSFMDRFNQLLGRSLRLPCLCPKDEEAGVGVYHDRGIRCGHPLIR